MRLAAMHFEHAHDAILEATAQDDHRLLAGLPQQLFHDRGSDPDQFVVLPQNAVVADERWPQRIARARDRIEKTRLHEFAHMPVGGARRSAELTGNFLHRPNGLTVFEELQNGEDTIGWGHFGSA